MLDKNSKKILRILNRTDFSFPSTQLQELTGLSVDEISRCLSYLRDNDYLHHLYIDGLLHRCTLTHKGVHYDEFEFIKFKEFLFKSVLTPIVVAAITTLITLSLTYLFENKQINNNSSNYTQNYSYNVSNSVGI